MLSSLFVQRWFSRLKSNVSSQGQPTSNCFVVTYQLFQTPLSPGGLIGWIRSLTCDRIKGWVATRTPHLALCLQLPFICKKKRWLDWWHHNHTGKTPQKNCLKQLTNFLWLTAYRPAHCYWRTVLALCILTFRISITRLFVFFCKIKAFSMISTKYKCFHSNVWRPQATILVKSCVTVRNPRKISSSDVYENYVCFSLFSFVCCQDRLLCFFLVGFRLDESLFEVN